MSGQKKKMFVRIMCGVMAALFIFGCIATLMMV
jgi:hypothetical protein